MAPMGCVTLFRAIPRPGTGPPGPAPGRSLADPSVHALAQQVGVAAVAGVLVDPVHQQFPHGDPVLPDALAQIRVRGERGVGGGLLALQVGEGRVDPACSATASRKSASRAPYSFGSGSPSPSQLRQSLSTSARCRSSPSSDIVDGGTDLRASCSASSPSHFIRRVRR